MFLTLRTALICYLTSNSFDEMAVETRQVSRISLFIKCLLATIFMKEYVNARIKSKNSLVLAYQAILSSGTHNSVNFYLISTNLISVSKFELVLPNKL